MPDRLPLGQLTSLKRTRRAALVLSGDHDVCWSQTAAALLQRQVSPRRGRVRSRNAQVPRLAELVYLTCIDQGASHGWALVQLLSLHGEIGKTWPLSRALTYRAIDRSRASEARLGRWHTVDACGWTFL